MTDVLILGGTGWLSGRIAGHWRDHGATVTCLARGTRPAPEGTVLVRGDREEASTYADLARREWDHVVDISSQAAHVDRAVEMLGDRAARWTYVSSVSVYSDDETVGADESAPRHPAAVLEYEYEYAAQKVAAEDSVARLGERALVVRPGLIVGDGDPSDRFGYWSAAFARADADAVLLPPLDGRSAQLIDVDDLAEYIVTARGSGPSTPSATRGLSRMCCGWSALHPGTPGRPSSRTRSGSSRVTWTTGPARTPCRCGSRPR